MKTNIVVIGAGGMLGNTMYRYLSNFDNFQVFGTLRSGDIAKYFVPELRTNLLSGVDINDFDSIAKVFTICNPDVVINCVGLVKQLADVEDPLISLPINSIYPHRLARLCSLAKSRLVHFSTDCVFSGRKGNYTEDDYCDSIDLYGRSKFIGEVSCDNAITLRTSIIGHELLGSRSLVGWFLSQTGTVSGFKNAIFSGLPTVEVSRVVKDFVIPNQELRGLYHLSSDPINKYDLLHIISKVYGHKIEIVPEERFRIDRSLDSTRFRSVTGYVPPSWGELVELMHYFK